MRNRHIWTSLPVVGLLLLVLLTPVRAKVTTLRYCTWSTEEGHRVLVDRFMERNPDIQVEFELVTGAYDDKILVQLASGVAADVIGLQDEPFPSYVRTGHLMDLTPMISQYNIPMRDFIPQTVEYFGYKDGIYALPTSGGAGLVIYNVDFFDQAGLFRPAETGWNFDSFMGAMRKLTRDSDGDGTPEVYAAQDMRSWLYAMPWMWMFGGKFIEVGLPDRQLARAATDTPEAIAMFDWMQRLRHEWRIMPPTTSSSFGFRKMNTATWQWSEGPWLTPALRDLESQGFSWDVAHMPTGPKGFQAARQSYDGVAINVATGVKEAAFRLVAYMMSIEGQKLLAAVSLPARRTAAMSPDFLRPDTPQHEHYFVQAMAEYAWMQPTNLHWVAAQNTVTKWFNSLRDGKTNPGEMSHSLTAELNGIFMESWPQIWRDYYNANGRLPAEADAVFAIDRALRSPEENARRKAN